MNNSFPSKCVGCNTMCTILALTGFITWRYYFWNVITLQALLYHLFLASRSFRLRSSTSSGRSIRFVLSKSVLRILVIFSIISSFSRSMRACRSLCDTTPFDVSDSFCFPSIPRLTTKDAPTEKRTKGRPALRNRNVLV